MLSKSLHLTNSYYVTRLIIIPCGSQRWAHQDHSLPSAVIKAKGVSPEELDEPNFFQKIYLRFKGIPLKGEKQRPPSILDNIGKYTLFEPLPKPPKDFKEFPERDLVNFPYPVKTEYPPKTRLTVVPDSWCREIEKITGTSGPYVVLGTLVLALLNKEWVVMDDNFAMLTQAYIPIYLFLNAAFRYRIDRWVYNKMKIFYGTKKERISNELNEAVVFRKNAKAKSGSLQAAQENFPTIFQENLALQLEAAYRKNVDYAWQELKRRLDYLQEVQETKERLAREVLLNSITQGVRKQIETNEGGIRDKYLNQCIEQLRMLAPK